MAFRLRYLAHDLELPVGEFVVGRSTDCQLSLDDPLISRRHSVLKVRRDGVSVQDLGSRNGVLVNGAKIDGERELTAGDKVTIGSQEMTLHNADEPLVAMDESEEMYRRATQTLGADYVVGLRAAVEGRGPVTTPPLNDPARALQTFQLLGGVANKALAMGRAEEAERILMSPLLDIIHRVREGNPVDAAVAEASAKYAARLAGATTKGTWVDYVIEMYKRLKRPPPAAIVDELHTVVRKAKGIDLTMLRAYLANLRAMAHLGPSERFVIQRLEGLERLVALK